MERIPTFPPVIKPLDAAAIRPLWSVMVPVYNCSDFLREALESVLSQDIPADQLQIEVVDDASSDADVEALVREVGKGRVRYYRQPGNVGSLRNFETCINRAQGRLVHILHGDDKVKVGYYSAMQQLFEEYPEAGAAFCRYRNIDEKGNPLKINPKAEMPDRGILKDWLLRISTGQRLQYVTITVKREVFEKLGGFYGKTYGEDWEMWVRIAKHYPVAYTPEILAEYREHSNSISSLKMTTGEYLEDIDNLITVIAKHLPQEHQKQIRKQARKNYAYYGMRVANTLWHSSNNKAYVMANLAKVLKLHTDTTLCVKAAKIVAKMLINRKKLT